MNNVQLYSKRTTIYEAYNKNVQLYIVYVYTQSILIHSLFIHRLHNFLNYVIPGKIFHNYEKDKTSVLPWLVAEVAPGSLWLPWSFFFITCTPISEIMPLLCCYNLYKYQLLNKIQL